MSTESVYLIVQLIDKQLSKIELKQTNLPAVQSLIQLRNCILQKFKPDSSINWTIKNKKLLKFFGFEVNWIH